MPGGGAVGKLGGFHPILRVSRLAPHVTLHPSHPSSPCGRRGRMRDPGEVDRPAKARDVALKKAPRARKPLSAAHLGQIFEGLGRCRILCEGDAARRAIQRCWEVQDEGGDPWGDAGTVFRPRRVRSCPRWRYPTRWNKLRDDFMGSRCAKIHVCCHIRCSRSLPPPPSLRFMHSFDR